MSEAVDIKNRIICGDWLAVLKEMPAGCVQCVVTSPPYWGLRDYKTGRWEGGDPKCDHKPNRQTQGQTGQRATRTFTAEAIAKDVCPKCGARRIDQQLGLEKSPAEYVTKLVEGFGELRRVLRDDGTVWLNMGDSYCGSWGDSGHRPERSGKPGHQREKNTEWFAREGHAGSLKARIAGLKPKDLCGIPWRVAFALQADGWWLRSDIIWAKPNPMPESVTDRPTRAHEYIFLLSKSKTYYYDQEAIREAPQVAASDELPVEGSWHSHTDDGARGQRIHKGKDYCPAGGRNKRSVWTIPTQAFAAAHFATFPFALVEPCILAGTSAKGCCPECGAPWKRLVSKDRKATRPARDNVLDNTGMANRDPQRHVTESQTVGWVPVCRCGFYGECATDDPVHLGSQPCLVLDPFMGSGTVAVVAKKLGRDFVGIELNADYVKLAEKRLRAEIPLLMEVRPK